MNPQTVESPVGTAGLIQLDFFPQIPVVVQPTGGQLTSDAGLLAIRQFDQRWNYTQRMAACLADPNPQRGQSLISMLRQRVFGVLAGYEDCNDHDTLRDDPVFKLIAERLPGDAAPGQPADAQPLRESGHSAGSPETHRLQHRHRHRTAQAASRRPAPRRGPAGPRRHRRADRRPSATDVLPRLLRPVPILPLIISEPTTKHVFVAWLRPGTVHASIADDDLLRVVAALRKQRPDIVIHVRADAGFGLPRMYEVCEQNHLTYTFFGFSTNARLKTLTEELMKQAVDGYQQTKEKQRLFDCFDYQCDSWDRTRRVIAKAECHDRGTNLRFTVTNRPGVLSAADGQPRV